MKLNYKNWPLCSSSALIFLSDYLIICCHSYVSATNETLGEQSNDKIASGNVIFYVVYLNIDNNAGYQEFESLEDAMNFKRGKDLVFRYARVGNSELKLIIEFEESKTIVLATNYYGLGENWVVYFNTLSNIVARKEFGHSVGEKLMLKNISKDVILYVYLSAALYILRNTDLNQVDLIRKEIDTFVNKLAI